MKKPFNPILGGKTSYYVLGLIILCAIAAFYLNKSRFFLILFVIISTLIPPFLFGLILYYLFNPLVDRLETKRFPHCFHWRDLSSDSFSDRFGWVSALSNHPKQTTDLINQFPDLIADFERNADSFLANTPFGAQIDQITDTLQKLPTISWISLVTIGKPVLQGLAVSFRRSQRCLSHCLQVRSLLFLTKKSKQVLLFSPVNRTTAIS